MREGSAQLGRHRSHLTMSAWGAGRFPSAADCQSRRGRPRSWPARSSPEPPSLEALEGGQTMTASIAQQALTTLEGGCRAHPASPAQGVVTAREALRIGRVETPEMSCPAPEPAVEGLQDLRRAESAHWMNPREERRLCAGPLQAILRVLSEEQNTPRCCLAHPRVSLNSAYHSVSTTAHA
jgi:hypothetical protein